MDKDTKDSNMTVSEPVKISPLLVKMPLITENASLILLLRKKIHAKATRTNVSKIFNVLLSGVLYDGTLKK